MQGTLTATVQLAGPFKVEAKPLAIRVGPTAYPLKKYIKPRNWMPVLGILLVLVIVAVIAAQRKKQQPNNRIPESKIGPD